MRIFMTGATGYIGSAVARAARDAGHTVHALAHHDDAATRLRGLGYLPRPGDLRDPDTLADHAREADAVIHTAQARGDDAAQIDESATQVMVHALEGTDRPFIYTSGVWVLGGTGPAEATETAEPSPTPLIAWRVPLERWIVEAGKRRAVRTIVLRPGIVRGGEGGIPAMTARGDLPVVGDGRQLWPLVHRDDLAELYVAALDRAPSGVILHGVSEHASPVEVYRVLTGPGDPVRVSVEEARAALGSFADALALSQRISSETTREVTGWTPRRSLGRSAETAPAREVA